MSETIEKKKVGRPKKNIEDTSKSLEVKPPGKKRGRKPKPKTAEDLLPKIPKKRGRKPKPKTAEDLLPKIPKKRGRKPKERVYSINNFNLNTKDIEDENIILHLPLSFNKEEDIDNENKDPIPYEPNNTLQSDFEIVSDNNNKDLENEIEDYNTDKHEDNDSITLSTIKDNMEDYIILKKAGIEDKNYNIKSIVNTNVTPMLYEFMDNNNEFISTTNVACRWCAHTFSTSPIGIPIKYFKEKFYVDGCFCSFNCAASYIFNENISEKWERYSLLNLMYMKLTGKKSIKIKLAPPKEFLRLFGGYMDIEEFRNSSLVYNKNHKVISPPLISVIPQLEEIRLENLNREKSSSLLNNNFSMLNENTGLKLKRNKPLSNKNQTLESYMSLKILQ